MLLQIGCAFSNAPARKKRSPTCEYQLLCRQYLYCHNDIFDLNTRLGMANSGRIVVSSCYNRSLGPSYGVASYCRSRIRQCGCDEIRDWFIWRFHVNISTVLGCMVVVASLIVPCLVRELFHPKEDISILSQSWKILDPRWIMILGTSA
jgi:hypothetical protein